MVSAHAIHKRFIRWIIIVVDNEPFLETIMFLPPPTRRPTCDKMTKGEILGYFRVFERFTMDIDLPARLCGLVYESKILAYSFRSWQ